MSLMHRTKNWRITNDSRLSLFVPFPSVILDFHRGYHKFGVAFGWLFFAVEIEYTGNKEKPL